MSNIDKFLKTNLSIDPAFSLKVQNRILYVKNYYTVLNTKMRKVTKLKPKPLGKIIDFIKFLWYDLQKFTYRLIFLDKSNSIHNKFALISKKLKSKQTGVKKKRWQRKSPNKRVSLRPLKKRKTKTSR